MELYFLTTYSFSTTERRTYELNLNKVGLSWDPILLRVHEADRFKHTAARFWLMRFWVVAFCWLSWYAVLYRLHHIRKVIRIRALLTREQKLAVLALESDTDLTPSKVRQLLTTLDPSVSFPESPSVPLLSDESRSEQLQSGNSKSVPAEAYTLKQEVMAWLVTAVPVLGLYFLMESGLVVLSADIVIGLIGVLLVGILLFLAYRKSKQPSEMDEPGIKILGMDKHTFSDLYARALLDETARAVLVGLTRVNPHTFTPREALLLRYALGEINKNVMAAELDELSSGWDSREQAIWAEQVKVMQSVLSEPVKRNEA